MTDHKLDLILDKLSKIEERLKRIEQSCGGMDSHIGFVENVYETLKSPMDYIKTYVNGLSGNTDKRLPDSQSRLE